ncbi:MAG TPA: FecR domain-containing protein, partial [Candidatus Acidoferrum sp.]
PVRASDNGAPEQAVPGTINYVEGDVAIGSEAIGSKSIGSAELQAGQSLTTQKGKAEILLTPGVFLRVGNDSSVKMISSSLTDTEVSVDQGHAMVEVAEIHPENNIRIAADGKTTQLLKTGLYDFDLKQGQLRVFDGKALVEGGNGHVGVKDGHEIALAASAEDQNKSQKFDKKSYEDDDLYRWSSLRSSYVAESNVDAAGLYAASGWGPWGPGWWGAGWYWDPWFDGFTFIPGDGIFYSPFGWGFYSPWFAFRSPFYGGHFPYHGAGIYHHFSENVRNWGGESHYAGSSQYAHGIYSGAGSSGGGFHSRSGAMHASSGGGFGGRGSSGGGGGFHGGGGGGGGFHGGGGGHGR